MKKKLDNEGITYYTLKWVEENKKSEIAYYRQKIEQWDIIDNIPKVFKELTNSLNEIPTNGVILLWLRNFYIGNGKFNGIREYYQNQIENSSDKNIILKASQRLRDLCYYQLNEGLITFEEVQRITQNIKFENYVYKKNSKTAKILDEILYGYKQLTEYEKLLQKKETLKYFSELNEKHQPEKKITSKQKLKNGYSSKEWCTILYFTDYSERNETDYDTDIIKSFHAKNKLPFAEKSFLQNFKDVKRHIEKSEKQAVRLIKKILPYFSKDKALQDYAENQLSIILDDLDRK